MNRARLAVVAPRELLQEIRGQAGEALGLIELETWIDANDRLAGAGAGEAPPPGTSEVLNATVIGVIVPGPPASERVGRAHELAAALSLPVYFQTPDPAGGQGALGLILEQLTSRLGSAQRAAALERAASARIRREFMDIQRDFTELEDFLYSLGAPRFSIALQVQAEGGEIGIPGVPDASAQADGPASSRSEILQPLPVSPRGLVAVDLQFTEVTGAGRIELALVDTGGVTIAQAAERALAACRLGMNRFRFESGARGPDTHALLRLRVTIPLGGSISLATGPATAVPRFAPTVNGRSAGDRVLAMTLWRGLAGVSLPRLATDVAPHQPDAARSYLMTPADMPAAQQLRAPLEGGGPTGPRPAPDRNAIIMRPSVNGPTLAIVPGIQVERLISVSAAVHVRSPSSPTVAFAVAALPQGEAAQLSEPAAALGEWLQLPARGWGEAHHQLGRPFTGTVDLLLAVAAAGPSESRVEAEFRSFRFVVAGEEAGG